MIIGLDGLGAERQYQGLAKSSTLTNGNSRIDALTAMHEAYSGAKVQCSRTPSCSETPTCTVMGHFSIDARWAAYRGATQHRRKVVALGCFASLGLLFVLR